MTNSFPMIRVKPQPLFRFDAGLNSFCLRGERPKGFDLAIMFDLSVPVLTTSHLPDAMVSGFIVRADASVPHVLGPRTTTQIVKTIIGSITINMVNVFRVFPCDDFPYHPMRQSIYSINRAMQITVGRIRRQRWFAGKLGIPCLRRPVCGEARTGEHGFISCAPSHGSRFGVVVYKFAKALGGWQWFRRHSDVDTQEFSIFQVLTSKAMEQ